MIKVKRIVTCTPPIGFPKLMKGPYNSTILFLDNKEGVILDDGEHGNWEVGMYVDDLEIDCCVELKGTLEMSNE